jgi:hypothetical protein
MAQAVVKPGKGEVGRVGLEPTTKGLCVNHSFVTAMSLLACLFVEGYSTVVAVADTAASTVIYAGKAIANTVDAITPDVMNKD